MILEYTLFIIYAITAVAMFKVSSEELGYHPLARMLATVLWPIVVIMALWLGATMGVPDE